MKFAEQTSAGSSIARRLPRALALGVLVGGAAGKLYEAREG